MSKAKFDPVLGCYREWSGDADVYPTLAVVDFEHDTASIGDDVKTIDDLLVLNADIGSPWVPADEIVPGVGWRKGFPSGTTGDDVNYIGVASASAELLAALLPGFIVVWDLDWTSQDVANNALFTATIGTDLIHLPDWSPDTWYIGGNFSAGNDGTVTWLRISATDDWGSEGFQIIDHKSGPYKIAMRFGGDHPLVSANGGQPIGPADNRRMDNANALSFALRFFLSSGMTLSADMYLTVKSLKFYSPDADMSVLTAIGS